MAELGRKEAERLIKEILTEYARKIRNAKKEEYIAEVQHLFSPDIDAFYKLVKSENIDLYILKTGWFDINTWNRRFLVSERGRGLLFLRTRRKRGLCHYSLIMEIFIEL